jgi:outer membrane protein
MKAIWLSVVISWRAIFWGAIFLGSGFTWAQPSSLEKPIRLTLEEAVSAGIDGATSVLKAKNQIEITGADLLQAYGAYLPNLTAQAGYGYSAGKSFSPTSLGLIDARYRTGDYSLSSSLNIFNGFGDQAFFNSARDRKRASSLTLDRVKQLIALDVSQAFWQVELDHELTLISQQNLEVSQNREKLFSAERQVGQLNAADFYRQQAETASDQSSLIQAKNREYLDNLSLIKRLRLDARQTYLVDPPALELSVKTQLPNEISLADQALGERADYQASSSDVTYARHTFLPTLDLVAEFGGEGRVYSRAVVAGQSILTAPQRNLWGQLGSQTVGSLMLNLNWDIFDRLVTTANVQKAQALESNAEIDLQDTRNQVVLDVRQALTEYKTALDQLEATEAALKAAQKAFDLINGRYRIGASNFLDLATAQATLVQAQANQAQARISLKLSGEAISTAMGRDPLGQLPF